MRPFYPIHPLYERLRTLRGALIVVEGIIGGGKTMLGQKLTKLVHDAGIPCKFFEEEVNLSLLELFLSDMKKYAFTFQLYMLSNRQKVYREAMNFARQQNGVAIIDRSLHGDIAFAQMHNDSGNISDEEWKVYENIVVSNSLPEPTVVIYLDVYPEVALERIHLRNRGSEAAKYTIDYLRDLDANYKVSMEESRVPIKYIDWNESRSLTEDELLDLLDNVDL